VLEVLQFAPLSVVIHRFFLPNNVMMGIKTLGMDAVTHVVKKLFGIVQQELALKFVEI